MGDIILRSDQQVPETMKVTYKDMSDGTHALVSAAVPVASIAGGYGAPTHTAFNVTNADQLVLATNTSRKYALFINDSDTVMYLKFGQVAAAVNEGIRLNANGGSYEMYGATLFGGEVHAIHAGGAVNKVLLITEGV